MLSRFFKKNPSLTAPEFIREATTATLTLTSTNGCISAELTANDNKKMSLDARHLSKTSTAKLDSTNISGSETVITLDNKKVLRVVNLAAFFETLAETKLAELHIIVEAPPGFHTILLISP